jgi:hypothetical protein
VTATLTAPPIATPSAAPDPRKLSAPRDPRLDFFRGLAMYIILVAHITDNPWTLWIPARFGFSDATEIFVFCSGMASAIAFGAVFDRAGWLMGVARIAQRVWQVYWAHIGVFLTLLLAMVALNESGLFNRDYVGALNLHPFLRETGPNLIGLMTLTYVPNYFDILPMYLVILAMIPVAMGLARAHVALVAVASLALWLATQAGYLRLPAELWFTRDSTRPWFFNPFGWQLVFFTGFALMRGWLPAPPVRRSLVLAAAAFVVLTVPLAWHETLHRFEVLREVRRLAPVLFDKSGFGLLRYVHFLAVAYLAWVAVGPNGVRLSAGTWWPQVVGVIRRVGQQSLAVFMTSMVLARLLGVVLDVAGRDALTTAAVNLGGFAIITGVAYMVRWLKGEPWRRPAPVSKAAAPQPSRPHGQINLMDARA